MYKPAQHRYLLKYRPVDQLFAEVEDDLRKWNNNGMIDRSTLLKIVQRCNAELGLKVHQSKETILEVDNYYAELPTDFYKLNYAFLATAYKYTYEEPFPKRQLEEVITLPPQIRAQVDHCQVTKLCCRDFVFTERTKLRTATVEVVEPVVLKSTVQDIVDEECPNWFFNSGNEISITKESVRTNFKEGALYFNYTGLLESEDGELLILDHDLINGFYEAAVKFKIFDILEDNQEPGASGLRQKWEFRYKYEKQVAQNIVNTPEFEELEQMWVRHRRRIYDRYYRMVE